jgi:hypothetical protein
MLSTACQNNDLRGAAARTRTCTASPFLTAAAPSASGMEARQGGYAFGSVHDSPAPKADASHHLYFAKISSMIFCATGFCDAKNR